tara:strand:- start:1025 stop:2008 length:984 start_codon:yes stop_codon:yes gene_type:complete
MNSITDGIHGDERNFVQVKDLSFPDSKYVDDITLELGKSYGLYIWFQNSASPSITEAVSDARMRVILPETVSDFGEITGVIGAANTKPAQVWDGVVLRNADPSIIASLNYVPGSAKIVTNSMKGVSLPKDLLGEGALIGCDQLDGALNGRSECAGYVLLNFSVDETRIDVELAAAKALPTTDHQDLRTWPKKYSRELEVAIGDEVYVRIEYKNASDVQQDDVVIRLARPNQGIEVTENPLCLINTSTKGKCKWLALPTSRIVSEGVNIGSHAPGANSFLFLRLSYKELAGYDFTANGQTFTALRATAGTADAEKGDFAKVLIFGDMQ